MKEDQFENMNVIIEEDSILINEMQYSQNEIKGTPRQPIDKKLYEKYNKKYLILTNSSSPIAKNGCNKLFWSEHFQTYVAAEW